MNFVTSFDCFDNRFSTDATLAAGSFDILCILYVFGVQSLVKMDWE